MSQCGISYIRSQKVCSIYKIWPDVLVIFKTYINNYFDIFHWCDPCILRATCDDVYSEPTIYAQSFTMINCVAVMLHNVQIFNQVD